MLGVLWVSNYVPTLKGDLGFIFEAPRIFSAYVASLAGMLYVLTFRWAAPIEAKKLSIGMNYHPLVSRTDYSRPVIRYVLSV